MWIAVNGFFTFLVRITEWTGLQSISSNIQCLCSASPYGISAQQTAPQLSSLGEQKQDKLSSDSNQSLPGEMMQHLGPMLEGQTGLKRGVAGARGPPWQSSSCWAEARWRGGKTEGSKMMHELSRLLVSSPSAPGLIKLKLLAWVATAKAANRIFSSTICEAAWAEAATSSLLGELSAGKVDFQFIKGGS